MNFRNFAILLISPLVFVDIVLSLPCRSYSRQLGECVPITKCPRLLAILVSADRTVQDLRMLQKLTCITEISDLQKDPIVCCPLKEISDVLLNKDGDESSTTQKVISSTRVPKADDDDTSDAISEDETPLQDKITSSAPAQISAPQQLLNDKLHLLPELKDCSNAITSERIIGGQPVSHGTYPWMARLGYKNTATGKLEYYCGGSVINKRYILTAGHCTQGFDENFVLSSVRLGEHDTSKPLDCNPDLGNICSLPEDFKIERIITHPQHNTVTKQNDIALLRLNQDVSFGSYFIQPICLPFLKEFNLSSELSKASSTTAPVVVAGWGRQMWNKTLGSPQLLDVSVPIVGNDKCQQLYKRKVTITPKQMCAGGVLGKDSCSGDSGGPLMGSINIPNKFSKTFQFGIVSFGQIQCGGPLPGVYTRVREYLPWILQNIEV